MEHAFLYGVILAFGLIIPLGIQNIFIFNQGVTQPVYIKAVPSVITAFICDAMLIISAVLGISLIVLTIPWVKNLIFIIGILFLSYTGYITWQNHTSIDEFAKPLSTKEQIIFATSVSLLNPHALLDSAGVIGTNSLHFIGYQRVSFTLGCMSVSLIWFFGLSIAGRCLNNFSNKKTSVLIMNKLSALIMWIVALYLCWQLIR